MHKLLKEGALQLRALGDKVNAAAKLNATKHEMAQYNVTLDHMRKAAAGLTSKACRRTSSVMGGNLMRTNTRFIGIYFVLHFFAHCRDVHFLNSFNSKTTAQKAILLFLQQDVGRCWEELVQMDESRLVLL